MIVLLDPVTSVFDMSSINLIPSILLCSLLASEHRYTWKTPESGNNGRKNYLGGEKG